MPRHEFYTRAQIAALCDVSTRQVVRWEGRYLTREKDPSDPSGRRVIYDGTEVENFLRRRQRRDKEGGDRGRRPSSKPPRRPEPEGNDRNEVRPSRVGAVLTRPRDPQAVEGLAVHNSGRRGGAPSSNNARPRDDVDVAKDRWDAELDEEKRRWEREHSERPPDGTDTDNDEYE